MLLIPFWLPNPTDVFTTLYSATRRLAESAPAPPPPQSDTSAAAALRDRLVGTVRVKSSAPRVDPAAVEAKLQQFADLRKIDQTATKVRLARGRKRKITNK